DSARPSLQIQVPLSSRGTPGRKAMVSIAVTGASGSMVNTSIQSLEPEAEPGASTQQAGTAQSKAATAAILAAAAAAAAGYCNTRATSSTASLAMAAAAAAAAFEGGQCQYTMGDQDRRFFGEPEETHLGCYAPTNSTASSTAERRSSASAELVKVVHRISCCPAAPKMAKDEAPNEEASGPELALIAAPLSSIPSGESEPELSEGDKSGGVQASILKKMEGRAWLPRQSRKVFAVRTYSVVFPVQKREQRFPTSRSSQRNSFDAAQHSSLNQASFDAKQFATASLVSQSQVPLALAAAGAIVERASGSGKEEVSGHLEEKEVKTQAWSPSCRLDWEIRRPTIAAKQRQI
ncbi:unnamed protein product, partial [Polarella glacialis]